MKHSGFLVDLCNMNVFVYHTVDYKVVHYSESIFVSWYWIISQWVTSWVGGTENFPDNRRTFLCLGIVNIVLWYDYPPRETLTSKY